MSNYTAQIKRNDGQSFVIRVTVEMSEDYLAKQIERQVQRALERIADQYGLEMEEEG